MSYIHTVESYKSFVSEQIATSLFRGRGLTEVGCIHLITQWQAKKTTQSWAVCRWMKHRSIKQVTEVICNETLVCPIFVLLLHLNVMHHGTECLIGWLQGRDSMHIWRESEFHFTNTRHRNSDNSRCRWSFPTIHCLHWGHKKGQSLLCLYQTNNNEMQQVIEDGKVYMPPIQKDQCGKCKGW